MVMIRWIFISVEMPTETTTASGTGIYIKITTNIFPKDIDIYQYKNEHKNMIDNI